MNCQAAAKSVSSTPVMASASDARTGKFGSKVLSQSQRRTGDGLAAGGRCYRRPPCSAQYRKVSDKVSEGRTEEPGTVRIARAEVLSPGTAGHPIVRWSPVKQPRSPHPRQCHGRVCGNRRPAQYQGRRMV